MQARVACSVCEDDNVTSARITGCVSVSVSMWVCQCGCAYSPVLSMSSLTLHGMSRLQLKLMICWRASWASETLNWVSEHLTVPVSQWTLFRTPYVVTLCMCTASVMGLDCTIAVCTRKLCQWCPPPPHPPCSNNYGRFGERQVLCG